MKQLLFAILTVFTLSSCVEQPWWEQNPTEMMEDIWQWEDNISHPQVELRANQESSKAGYFMSYPSGDTLATYQYYPNTKRISFQETGNHRALHGVYVVLEVSDRKFSFNGDWGQEIRLTK